MSELKQAMTERVVKIKPKSGPVKVRPSGYNPKMDDRAWNFDRKRNVWTRINLDNYEKGVY